MKVFRGVIAFFLLFSVLFTVFYGKDKISEKIFYEEESEYKGILSLWQIDCFEGGVGSRRQFLLDVAASFEKKNQGVLVMVCNYTTEEAEKKLNEGVKPDMISFGGGIRVNPECELSVHGEVGGKVGNKTYAAVWCRGGYFLFYKEENLDFKNIPLKNLVVSKQKYTLPLVAALEYGIKAERIEYVSSAKAYSDFANGKIGVMIGTQRDLFRLNNRGISYKAEYLGEFTDLNQYLSITSTDRTKQIYCQRYAEYLMSEEIQKKLKKIGMSSYVTEVEYEEENLLSMQTVQKSTVSAFLTPEKLLEIQLLSEKAVIGDEESEIKIKKLIARP